LGREINMARLNRDDRLANQNRPQTRGGSENRITFWQVV
jgi:hypothetical protein